MERLIAINENQAVYYHDDSRPDVPLDPFKYLNDFLSIRSARGLVSFMKDHPHGLRDAVPSFDIETEVYIHDQRSIEYSGCSKRLARLNFSPTSVMNAADSLGIEYLDAQTSLTGHYDEWNIRQSHFDIIVKYSKKYGDSPRDWPEGVYEKYLEESESIPEPDLYHLSILDLENLFTKLENVLLIAAASFGLGEMVSYLEFRKNWKWKDATISNAVLVPYWLLHALMPKWAKSTEIAVRLKEWTLAQEYSSAVFECEVPNEDISADNAAFFVGLKDKNLAIRTVAAVVTSFILSQWITHFNSLQCVTYDLNNGYVLHDSSMNDVVMEICNVVIEGRLGVCPVCGRPFVVKRKPIDGQLNKKYCTDSCKVKDRGMRKEEEQNGKEETA